MNQEYYKTLLILSFQQKLSAEQSAELEEWLKQDLTHITIQKQLESAWEDSALYKSNIKVDQEQAWKKISGGISKTKSTSTVASSSRIIPMFKVLLAAASIVFLLGVGWYFQFYSQDQSIHYASQAGQTLDISLPDGSMVTLNENSQLAYSIENNERKVNLTGEAYFEVSHDKEKPFKVFNQESVTTVLGTKFNVDGSQKNEVKVSLLEGKISFAVAGQETIILAPNETVSYSVGAQQLEHKKEVDENTLSYKNNILKFKNKEITTVIKTLEDHFDKKIELILDKENCLFTGTFNNPQFNEILKVLRYTYDLTYTPGKTVNKLQIHNCK